MPILKMQKVIEKLRLRQRTEIWGEGSLSIHWLNKCTSQSEKTNTSHMRKNMCMNGQQPTQTGDHLVQKMNVRGRYISKNPEQGGLKKIKRRSVFKQKHILAISQV